MALLAFVNSNAVISHKPNGFGYGNEAERANDRVSERAGKRYIRRAALWYRYENAWFENFPFQQVELLFAAEKKSAVDIGYLIQWQASVHMIYQAHFIKTHLSISIALLAPPQHISLDSDVAYTCIIHALCLFAHSPMFGHILLCTLDRTEVELRYKQTTSCI